MLFCPKCGSMLIPKAEGNKKRMACSCGYSSKEKEDIVLQESLGKKEKIEIVQPEDIEIMPKVDEDCPKCHNKKSYFWTVQTRAGDEAETRFFECVKCKHRWREYR